jgi:hypothetical protein
MIKLPPVKYQHLKVHLPLAGYHTVILIYMIIR